MPLFDYQCPRCGDQREVLQKDSAPPPVCWRLTCDDKEPPPMVRLLSSPAFVLKGKGWARDGYGG